MGKIFILFGYLIISGVVLTNNSAIANSQIENINGYIVLYKYDEGSDSRYREVSRARTIQMMLHGNKAVARKKIDNQSQISKLRGYMPAILSEKLEFISAHLDEYTKDSNVKIVTGQDSFLSKRMNKNTGKIAKLAGATFDFKGFTMGGGYSWDERHPTYDDYLEDGLVFGIGVPVKDYGYLQASYITTHADLGVFKIGSSEEYSSTIIGYSHDINDSLSFTITAQFHEYHGDDKIIARNETLFTIGTKYNF